MRWCGALILETILVICTATSFAQGQQDPNGPGDSGGWVIAAYIGGAHTHSSSLTIMQPSFGTDLTFENVRLESRSFDPPLYYGVRGSYFLPKLPHFGIEAELIHLKVFSNPQQRVRVTGVRRGTIANAELPLGEIVQQYSISHGVNLLLFNAAVRHAPSGRVILSARAGLGPTLPHTESRIEGQSQEQYEVGRIAWQAAAGAEVRLWKGLFASAEYKFTRTRQNGKVFFRHRRISVAHTSRCAGPELSFLTSAFLCGPLRLCVLCG